MKIEVVRGSLLDQDVEAIVNAANSSMRGGSGIDGAVHRAAGPELIQELMRVAPHGAKTPKVVATPGYQTGFKYVFHVAGPVWNGGSHGEEEALALCYENAVICAAQLEVASLGFCSISTGIFRFPLELAVPIALETVSRTAVGTRIERVVFAMFQEAEYRAFAAALESINPTEIGSRKPENA